MSDLQISLLLIGVVVVGCVLLFNWWQAQKLRRRLAAAFEDTNEDVLLGESAAGRAAATNVRVEPQIGAADIAVTASTGAIASAPELPPSVAGIDDVIDCVATVRRDAPLSPGAVAELMSGVAACGKSWRAAGYNAGSRKWEEVNRTVSGQYSELRLALQIANRAGPVSAVQLSAFSDAVQAIAAKASAQVQMPDVDATLRRAQELDLFCADVDVAIGINVVAPDEGAFSGARIRGMVEAEGFALEPDGVFHLEDEHGQTLLTLGNQNPAEPMLPESIGSMTTRGLTLLLDVPRVAQGEQVLERMFELGRSLSVTLKGRLVDDNRAALTAAGMDQIRKQLKDIHVAMNARGILPGSGRALRLFS